MTCVRLLLAYGTVVLLLVQTAVSAERKPNAPDLSPAGQHHHSPMAGHSSAIRNAGLPEENRPLLVGSDGKGKGLARYSFQDRANGENDRRDFVKVVETKGHSEAEQGKDNTNVAQPTLCKSRLSFGFSTLDAEGVNISPLVKLTKWIREAGKPVFSLLVSRRGKILFELYSPRIQRDDAHYLMSVTKSVVSALAGIAIDRQLVAGPEISIAEALPRSVFPDDKSYKTFGQLSIKNVMAMSALDVPKLPHQVQGKERERSLEFYTQLSSSSNRLKFALNQSLLRHPGKDFLYSDATPGLMAGVIQYATGQSLFDFAKESLFNPLQFQNADWMHQDIAGLDNAGFGLRLRPIDMQKLGVLYLNSGCWEGLSLISESWIRKSLTPWIRSHPTKSSANYGWYWWKEEFKSSWTGNLAQGWQGQRIAIFPGKDVVVTMTAAISDGSEDQTFARIINRYVIPAIDRKAKNGPAASEELQRELEELANRPARFARDLEHRMIPSSIPKEFHRPFFRE